MSSLLLNSVEIENFRAFRRLQVAKLGRVNLIVGKNNVGKSSLLEALHIYACRNHSSIWEMLTNREEGHYPSEIDLNTSKQKLRAIRFLFYGRPAAFRGLPTIRIGEIDNTDKQVAIEFKMSDEDALDEVRPRLVIRPDTNAYPIVDYFNTNRQMTSGTGNLRCTFIPTSGLTGKEIDLLWSRIALTHEEKEVLRTLNIISPTLEGVGIISNPELGMARTAIAKIAGTDEPIPLQSMGDGINRLFYTVLALINSRNGFLLIDEIGTGLHYSVQLELWRLIFSIVAKLNVQVFATTHSNDSIMAFQVASKESQENGMLIRLENRNGKMVSILFDEERLAIATREEIEVR